MANVSVDFLRFIFFIYGLAFFVLGLSTALESRRRSPLMLASSLPFLAAFGFGHSVTVWTDMFLLGPSPVWIIGGEAPIRAVRTILLAISAIFLAHFGATLIVNTTQRHFWLRWVPLGLFAVWLFSLFLPHLFATPSVVLERASGLCLTCHGGPSDVYLPPSGDWVTSADVWARYLLYLPGCLLAAAALLSQRSVLRSMGLPVLARDCAWAAGAFAFNSVLAGLVVPPAGYFPASVVNYASFFDLFHIPPQVFRAGAALAITYFVVSVLRIFEIEHQQRLERANQERLLAQEQALQAQRLAQDQLERWNRELEERVEQRTREVEHRNRELAILEERDRIGREIHDSLAQTLSYLSLRLMTIERGAGSSELPSLLTQIHQMQEALDSATADVRNAILSLKTTISPDGALIPVLKEYVQRFQEQTGLRVDMVVNNEVDRRLQPQAKGQVLRIVQEALTNVRKHANVGKARVRFEIEPGQVSVAVEDEGCGFDRQLVEARGRHFGLQTMEERAREAGGVCLIESSPGKGTRVLVRIPGADDKEGGAGDNGPFGR